MEAGLLGLKCLSCLPNCIFNYHSSFPFFCLMSTEMKKVVMSSQINWISKNRFFFFFNKIHVLFVDLNNEKLHKSGESINNT